MSTALAVITPAYNDAEGLRALADTMALQTAPPTVWIVVDDGSDDDTPEVTEAIVRRLPFARRLCLPPKQPGDGLAGAAEVHAFHAGLALLEADAQPWDAVVKLDADLELAPDFFAQATSALDADPALGIVGGHLVERHGDQLVDMDRVPEDHVRGATKVYRRACFEEIGGIPALLGWDTIDEIRAQRAGWTTRTVSSARAVHRRPRASRGGHLRGMRRTGRCAYLYGSGPMMVSARTARYLRRPPYVLGAFAFVIGYVAAGVRRTPRTCTPQERAWLRTKERARALSALRLHR